MRILHSVLLFPRRYKRASPSLTVTTVNCLTLNILHQHTKKQTSIEQWIPATAPRVEPATAEHPALAQTAPAPPARRAAAHAAHQAAASAHPAACAKGRNVTAAAVSEETATSVLYCPCNGAFVNNS